MRFFSIYDKMMNVPNLNGKKYTKVREELVGEIKEFSGVWGQLDKVLGN